MIYDATDRPYQKISPYGANTYYNYNVSAPLAQLRSDDAVLDVGCGIGRTAAAMTKFLSPAGRYAGFDVIEFAIRWCREHISMRHPNFTFVHSDVYNNVYNPRGRILPEQYRFPFSPGEFTFCLATSVFTHVLPATAEQYTREVRRVLRPGKRFLSTWFLLDEPTEGSLAGGRPAINFKHRFENHAQSSLLAPEQAVAYPLGYVERLLATAGLKIVGIHHGGWSGVPDSIDSGQDVIVAESL